jgi:hypothetical protein
MTEPVTLVISRFFLFFFAVNSNFEPHHTRKKSRKIAGIEKERPVETTLPSLVQGAVRFSKLQKF